VATHLKKLGLNDGPFPKQRLGAPLHEAVTLNDSLHLLLRTVVSLDGNIFDNLIFHLVLCYAAKGLVFGIILTMLIYKCVSIARECVERSPLREICVSKLSATS